MSIEIPSSIERIAAIRFVLKKLFAIIAVAKINAVIRNASKYFVQGSALMMLYGGNIAPL